MDSSATLSFPSEPADIGELFSSYKYESPELNSVDDFKGCRELEDVDCGGTRNEVQKEEDCLVTDVEIASSGTLLFEKRVENNNLANEDIGSSCPLSLCSEPPDIRNWFSSYVYESSALDSNIDFGTSASNDAVNDAENREHISGSVGAARNELGLMPAVLLGCRESAKDVKSEFWLECGQKYDGIMESVCKLEKQRINNDNNAGKQFESHNETSDRNLEKRFSFDESRILLETNSGHDGAKSSKKLMSTTENFNAQRSPEDTNKISRSRRMDSMNQMNTKHSETVPNGDNEKENSETEFAQNGFISTRKHKQNSSQRSLRPSRFSITGAVDLSSSKGNATSQRKVLSETTNIQRATVLETTVKWKCPQQHKSNLGPPLKQLRLEKWVHRL